MRYIKLFVFSSILFFMFTLNCFASDKTYTRTNDNLLVPKDVVVDDSNREDILKTPAVSSREKIYDFAKVLTDEEEDKIYKRVNYYIDSSDIDMVIVTTKNLCGFSVADYTSNFYDYNDFLDTGVIFVIYINDSEDEIFMYNIGDKPSSIYYDSRIHDILKYVYKDISTKNYYKAIDNYTVILQGFYNREEKGNGNYSINENGEFVKDIPWVEIIVLAIALTFIIIMIFIYKINGNNRLNNSNYLDNQIDKSNMIIKTMKDELVDTSNTK